MFKRATAGPVGVVLLLLVAIGGCGESSTAAPLPPPTTQRLPPKAVASCNEAGRPDPPKGWTRDAAVAGPFGLYGPGRDFHQMSVVEYPNGQFGTKLPAIVERSATVTVTVPPTLRRKVGLDYGDFDTETRVKRANSVVTFKPCAGRHKRTGWPGGLVLKSRRPIELQVQVEGEDKVRTLAVG